MLKKGPFAFAVYNAGTDTHSADQLGGLALSDAGVLERDSFVFDALAQKNIPTVMVLSGGYSSISYRLVYESVRYLLETYAA